jgi:hypothetical protein
VSTALVRMKFAAVAAKVETTPGTDVIAGSPAAADWLSADCQISFNPETIQLSEYTGTLDNTAPVVGGLKPRLQLRIPLRGSGAAATAPDWSTLMKCCTFVETATAAAIGTPTAAASGTTTTVTAASPFGTTAQQYRHMPLIVTGDQSFTTGITNYTAARVITMGETRTSGLTVSSLLQIPVNNLYTPTSDETVYKTATIYCYADGLLWAFTGAVGSVSVELTTGGMGFLVFDMTAQYSAKSAVSLPAGAATAAATRLATVPPRFVAGKCQLDKGLAQVRSLMFNANVAVVLPDDPESAEGYGPAVPVGRSFGGSMDPLMNTSNAVARMNLFRNGTAANIIAVLGSTAGNRFLLSAHSAIVTANDPGARDGLGQHGISFSLNGPDNAFGLCAF